MNLQSDRREYWSESFVGLDFSGLEIAGKEFDGCSFTECNFTETMFKNCNFVDSEFSKCNLSVMVIEYSKFSDVVFHECKIIGVNWTKVSWPGLLLSAPVKFFKCILTDSSFLGQKLPDIVMEQCKAHHVDFRDGDFSNAEFAYTDFSGSLFSNTNLTGANFCEASNYDIDIYNNIIKQAKFTRFEAVSLLESLEIELHD